jgi:integrase
MSIGHIRRHPQGGWVADITIAGRRRQLKAPTKRAAQQRLNDEIEGASRRAAEPSNAPAGFTLQQALSLCLKVRWKGERAWDRTAAIYAEQLVAFFGPKTPLAEIRAREVNEYRQHLLDQGNAAATVNKKISCLSSMQSEAVLHGHLPDRPMLPRQLKLDNTRDAVFTDRDVTLICGFLKEIGHLPAADLFVFLVETGCRWGEAASLVGADVDLERSTVTFSKTKGNRPRTIPMTMQARSAIEGNLPPLPHYRVWPYTYERFRRMFERARLHTGVSEELTLHSCRHTCLTRLAQRNVSLAQIRAWGGHSTLTAVARYLHVQTDALSTCVEALEARR